MRVPEDLNNLVQLKTGERNYVNLYFPNQIDALIKEIRRKIKKSPEKKGICTWKKEIQFFSCDNDHPDDICFSDVFSLMLVTGATESFIFTFEEPDSALDITLRLAEHGIHFDLKSIDEVF